MPKNGQSIFCFTPETTENIDNIDAKKASQTFQSNILSKLFGKKKLIIKKDKLQKVLIHKIKCSTMDNSQIKLCFVIKFFTLFIDKYILKLM